MFYSKATNYALHTMLELAKSQMHNNSKKIGVIELAQTQEISPTYLSKILTKLTKAGLIESTVGAQGGYCLARQATDISFLEIIQTIEGSTPLFKGCESTVQSCKIDQIMKDYEANTYAFLAQRSLQDAL